MFVVAAIDCISWMTCSLMAWEGKQHRNENTTPVFVSGSTFHPPFLPFRLFLQQIFFVSVFPPSPLPIMLVMLSVCLLHC